MADIELSKEADLFVDFEQEETPEEIPSVTQAKELTPEQQAEPSLIDYLKEDELFGDFQDSTTADDDALLDQNQTLIDSLISKTGERFFGEDVEDPFIIPRAIGIIAGSLGAPALANSALPPGTPPLVRGGVTLGASAFGTVIGSVAPELTIEIAESLSLVDPDTRARFALNAADLQTVVEGEVLIDAAFGTGFTVLRQLGRITGRFFTTGGVLTEEGRKSLGLAEDVHGKFGISMLPVQIRGQRVARGFSSVLGHFPFFTGPLKGRAKAVEQQMEKAARELGPRLAPLAAMSDVSADIMIKGKRVLKDISRKFNIGYTRIYQDAERLGVRVTPKLTSVKTRELIRNAEKARSVFAKGADGKAGLGDVTGPWVKFLRENFIPLETITKVEGAKVELKMLQESGKPFVELLPDIPANIAKQDLHQMDGLVDKIDEFISTLDKTSNQDQFIRKQAIQLKSAIQADMLTNVSGRNMGDAKRVTERLKTLGEDYSLTMSRFFETATANRFGSVKKGGLGGRGILRTATRQPEDMLAKTLIQLDSPQAMKDLRLLTGKKTFRQISSTVINNGVEKAFKTVQGSDGSFKQFDVGVFKKEFGLGQEFSSRRAAVAKMLDETDSPFKIKDLETLADVMQRAQETVIPDVAQFVARRAILGGLTAAVGTFAIGHQLSGSVPGGTATMLLAGALFVGGSRLFSKLISNPDAAKSFAVIFNKKAPALVKRNAYIRAMRAAAQAVRGDDKEVTPESAREADQMMEYFRALMPEIDNILGIEGPPVGELLKEGSQIFDIKKEEAPEVDISQELEDSDEFGGGPTLK